MHEVTIITGTDGEIVAVCASTEAAQREVGERAISGHPVVNPPVNVHPVLGVPEIADPFDKVDEFVEKASDFILGSRKRDKRS